jgi:hypothetical protein
MAEKRMVVENERVRKGERRVWDLPEMLRKGQSHPTFILSRASAVVRREVVLLSYYHKPLMCKASG